jgi:DNA-binding response OmpR family regulator
MRGSVLIVDDDLDISTIVAEVLTAEGFVVSELADAHPGRIQAEVARLEPDLVLLDGGEGSGYGYSWLNAAWMHERSRPIPVIMFTGHSSALAEAQIGLSERSKHAAFVGFLSKPFDLRELVEIVARVVDEPTAVRALAAVGPPPP